MVNFGNFDSKGANVDRRRPDNANAKLGVLSSRSLIPFHGGKKEIYFMDFIQPPSIFPISWRDSSKKTYFLSLMALVSIQALMRYFKNFSLISILLSIRSLLLFWLFECAKSVSSMTSRMRFSHLCPKVNLSFLGNIWVVEFKAK